MTETLIQLTREELQERQALKATLEAELGKQLTDDDFERLISEEFERKA